MKWILLLAMLCMLAILPACNPVHNYTPAIDFEYGPHPPDATVDVFMESPPDRRYNVIGHVDCRGANLEEVIPFFKKLAREHGGDAIINIRSEEMSGDMSKFFADVIRYK